MEEEQTSVFVKRGCGVFALWLFKLHALAVTHVCSAASMSAGTCFANPQTRALTPILLVDGANQVGKLENGLGSVAS